MEGGKCPTLCKKGGVCPGGGNVWRGNMSGGNMFRGKLSGSQQHSVGNRKLLTEIQLYLIGYLHWWSSQLLTECQFVFLYCEACFN